MPINQGKKLVPITSPVKGVNTVVNREGQPPDTCWAALNMLPFDRYGRKRVAQRPGLTAPWPSFLGPGFIQCLEVYNNIFYPASVATAPSGPSGFSPQTPFAYITTTVVGPSGGSTPQIGPINIISIPPGTSQISFQTPVASTSVAGNGTTIAAVGLGVTSSGGGGYGVESVSGGMRTVSAAWNGSGGVTTSSVLSTTTGSSNSGTVSWVVTLNSTGTQAVAQYSIATNGTVPALSGAGTYTLSPAWQLPIQYIVYPVTGGSNQGSGSVGP